MIKLFKLFGVFLLLHYSILAQNLSGHITLSNQEFTNLDIVGLANFNNVTANYLTIVGSLHFNKLNSKNLSIAGILNGNIGNFNKLIIKGTAKLKNITSDTLNISSRDNQAKISIIDSSINQDATLESPSVNIINSVFNKLTIDAGIIYLTDIKATKLIVDSKKDTIVNILEKIDNITHINTITFTHKGLNFIKLPKKFKNNHHTIIKKIIGAKIKYEED